jgi:hypothetical protein
MGIDKLYHLTAGALAAFVGFVLGNQIGAVALATVAAVGKEVYDWVYNRVTGTQAHTPDPADALFTVFGAVPVLLLLTHVPVFGPVLITLRGWLGL